MRRLASLAFASIALSLASAANAQDALAPPPPPASAVAAHGEYVAPLQQQTQQTYVPQSIALSGPLVIRDWEDGEPVPPGYHKGTRTRSGLIVGGAITFGAFYVISAFVAAGDIDSKKYCQPYHATKYSPADTCQAAGFLFVPVAGPFIEMARTGRGSALGEVSLALDGIAQTAGAAMLYAGITMPKIVLVRNDIGTNKPVEKLSVTPYFAGTTGGVIGSF